MPTHTVHRLTSTDLLHQLDVTIANLYNLRTLLLDSPDLEGARALDTATEKALNLLLTHRRPVMNASTTEIVNRPSPVGPCNRCGSASITNDVCNNCNHPHR